MLIFNVVKKWFAEINKLLKHLFNLGLDNGISPKIKISQVTPHFKNGDPKNITNYHSISALPCFLLGAQKYPV